MASACSSKKSLCLELGGDLLAKLTHESPEIRVRALDQIETCFIRCLQNDNVLRFDPVLLLKQLIRWFAYTPPLIADRVLALMLGLLRSDYRNVIVKQLKQERLSCEFKKIRQRLESLNEKHLNDIMDDLEHFLPQMYTDSQRSSSKTSSDVDIPLFFTKDCKTDEIGSIDVGKMFFSLTSDDYEEPWSQAVAEDYASMKTLAETLTLVNDADQQNYVTQLQVKMSDYPVEYLLQSPHIFLRLLNLQKQAGIGLKQVNFTIIAFLGQLQERIRLRNQTLNYAVQVRPPSTEHTQVRLTSAMTLVLKNCMKLLSSRVTEKSSKNWTIVEVIIQTIRTFEILIEPIPILIIKQISQLAIVLIKICNNIKCNEIEEAVIKMTIPRLTLLICNGLLQDSLSLNLMIDKEIDKTFIRTLMKSLVLDNIYLSCVPAHSKSLNMLISEFSAGSMEEEKQIMRLKNAYGLALDQLQSKTQLNAQRLLHVQRQICLVVNQLDSVKLIDQLFSAIITCTPLFNTEKKLRDEAESLLNTLFDLPKNQLRCSFFKMMKRYVVEHFHAVMNKTKYMEGCNSKELVKRGILGVPLNVMLLRKLLVQCYSDNVLEVQEICTDIIIMFLKLATMIRINHSPVFESLLWPVIPQMVASTVKQPQIQQHLWKLFDPDNVTLTLPIILLGNICHMFHKNDALRKEAIARIVYILRSQDVDGTKKPIMNNLLLPEIGENVFIIQPPRDYLSIFCDRRGNQNQHDFDITSIVNLLKTTSLKSSIRKSGLTQLNVLIQDFRSFSNFMKEKPYKFALDVICAPLKDISSEVLAPAIGILMKTLLCSINFSKEITKSCELHICLMRAVCISPHDRQLHHDVSICLFLLLYSDFFKANASTFTLTEDLSNALHVPLTYELDQSECGPPSAATEGLDIEEHLAKTYFCDNIGITAAQHWRQYVASHIFQSTRLFKLEPLEILDIKQSLKLRPMELALVLATKIDERLNYILNCTSNCSNHKDIIQLISSVQLFLVLKRGSMSSEQSNSVWQLIHKFIRLAPGNVEDFKLFTDLLELCLSCLHHQLPHVVNGLNLALEIDPHHSFLVMLHDRALPFEVFQLISKCLSELLRLPCRDFNWHGKLFIELTFTARLKFDLRQLLNVRCLLNVLHYLSAHKLKFSDVQLSQYIVSYIDLSSNLITSTQTGAQWQRDCLQVICNLQSQTSDKYPISEAFNIKTISYLLSLCGYCDNEIRALGWVCTANFLSRNPQKFASIVSQLKFFPGGFHACCLTTLLDTKEMMLLRTFAGRVFEMLMDHINVDQLVELLHHHSFMKEAHAALGALHSDSILSKSFNYQTAGAIHSCDIINCYVIICIRLVKLLPHWGATLCKEDFMTRLCDVMKMAPPLLRHKSYLLMWNHICNLYCLLYPQQFDFLQRTICRDPVFMQCYQNLLDHVADLSILHTMLDADELTSILVTFLKMFLIFCKDENAYNYLTELFEHEPRALVKVLMHSLHVSLQGTKLQQMALSALTLLSIKSQVDEGKKSLLKVLETHIPTDEGHTEYNKDDNKENIDKGLNLELSHLHLEQHKTTDAQKDKTTNSEKSKPKKMKSVRESSVIVLIYPQLDRLFEQNFQAKTFCFLNRPTPNCIQVCEALGTLLKLSQPASETARGCLLLERILQLIENFLNSSLGDACAYVRRVGAHKTRELLDNLVVLFSILLHWHSSHHAIITDPSIAVGFIRILVRIWPWLSHSSYLKEIVVLLAAFLTEHSFEMCKQASIGPANHSHSLLQLMVRVADHETTRRELHNSLVMGAVLRVMANCCSCSEGRLSLSKMHVLDIFDTILPGSGNTSQALKIKPDILRAWIEFWDVYSRYNVGAKACHMHALINAVLRSPPLSSKRLLCLRILRNICFLKENRTQLVGMTQLLDLMYNILQEVNINVDADNKPNQCDKKLCAQSYQEKYLVSLSIWKLFGFGAKYKSMLRGTNLEKRILLLSQELMLLNSENPIVFKSISYAAELQEILKNILLALTV